METALIEPKKQTLDTKITFEKLQTLQVNIGNICNNHCKHCHINAGPNGKNIMSLHVINNILNFADKNPGLTIDITGGAPEMHPAIKYLIKESVKMCKKVIVRTNLTVLMEEPYEDMPEFFKENKVSLIASLPCYAKQNVDKQRGLGTFDASIQALRKLNKLGYGREKNCELNIVYNPLGNFLPAPQNELEYDYKQHLKKEYGIVFSKLFTITNMPLGRFATTLRLSNKYDKYVKLLIDNHNPENIKRVMCKTQISVDWQGMLYNCDFNQAAQIPIRGKNKHPLTSKDLINITCKDIETRTATHCYGCTAGAGSSCQGSLS